MKDNKTIILAVILLLLVGVYVWYSQKLEQEKKPTGKPVNVAIPTLPDKEIKNKVLHAVTAYKKDKGDAPKSLAELKGKYLDEGTYKEAAEKVQYTYKGPGKYGVRLIPASSAATKLAAKKSSEEKQPGAGKTSGEDQKKQASATPAAETGETVWSYTVAGRSDPFKSFIVARAAQGATPEKRSRPLTPLQKMPLSEIERGLKAIVWGKLGNKALVEDATGKGYVVQEGTYVGQNDGIVKKIGKDRIIVEEYRRDPLQNHLVAKEIVLKLKKMEE